ncbi:biotin--[acetyl-CoA-carboxylase] ligase [Agromyces protaetiae]|uniref:biotin--[biotin carboxyl-carrier protein] ligase n=1 Tax=Agromyces protaetiae TaxID=2509455 RepID=A0A4V0YHG2_9MICO|nr:biotin--[acetyl-CoA-carboxylase] ligase [Agromyces protaetiae]QAY74601.1 biotin--[acetyl-CoA-carboxylase] ligase [Agromyces protaetiae]
MVWERSRAVATRFAWLEQTGSTNDDLREAVETDASGWPHGAVIATDDQTAGRGRLGRTWLAPTGKTLAISLLLRPAAPLPPDAYGWLPLLAGAAMTEAVGEVVAEASARRAASAEPGDDLDGIDRDDVGLKWPNDVHIAGYKVCGILCELLPDGGVVVGAGLNLTLDEHDLPTITSTSLLLATGERPDADAVLADYVARILAHFDAFAHAGGDAVASGLADLVSGLCETIGQDVRVELPGGAEFVGTAERLDRDGRLVVRDRENDEPQAVAAGDVTHLRY